MKKPKQCNAWVWRRWSDGGRCVNNAVEKGLCRIHAKKLATGKSVLIARPGE